MKKNIFVTGISTDVGKTIISAILTEALHADYWKPVQAGELAHTDLDTVKELISNSKSNFHPITYALKTPMSPHAAAEIDQVEINPANLNPPKTDNHLIMEGAGGLLVPISNTLTILDIIPKQFHVVVVSRHYLGSINHTLLTINALLNKGFEVSVIFSGKEHKSTEDIIQSMTNVKVIGRVDEEPCFNPDVILKYANLFREKL